MVAGVVAACPQGGNLCGLFGFFVAGPIAAGLALALVGCALSIIRP